MAFEHFMLLSHSFLDSLNFLMRNDVR